MKRKPKTPLAIADELCGRLVRARGSCEYCGSTQVLQWAHGFPRSYRRIRHDERNGFCLCRACHMHFTHRPLEWDEWLHEHMGSDVYDDLRAIAMSTDGQRVNLKETIAHLRVRLVTVNA